MQYQFDVSIAQQFSLEEAVFVHRIFHWVQHNQANDRNFHDGRYWTHDSVAALVEVFPFWSARQIQRIVQKCKDNGLILTACLSENKRDRTLSYTVTDLVNCIYRNGEMDFTKRLEPFHQTVKCIYSTNKRPNKRHSEKSEETRTFGEFENITLTEAEWTKLCGRWPEHQVREEIENLSSYMKSKGKRYQSHYATLLNWLKRDYPEPVHAPSGGGTREL